MDRPPDCKTVLQLHDSNSDTAGKNPAEIAGHQAGSASKGLPLQARRGKLGATMEPRDGSAQPETGFCGSILWI